MQPEEPMEVEEIFEKIRLEKKLDKKQFAKYIGIHPTRMSGKFGDEWNLHWRVFKQLLPDCIRLGIISPDDMQVQELQSKQVHAERGNVEGHKAAASKIGQRRKERVKKIAS